MNQFCIKRLLETNKTSLFILMIKYIFFLLPLMLAVGCKNTSQQNAITQELYNYDIEAKLDSLGIQLSTPSPPVANYVNVVQTGKLLFLAGKGPKDQAGNNIVGRLGDDMNLMVEVFGDNGKHARAAVGMSALPGGICAEIEMIVEIE